MGKMIITMVVLLATIGPVIISKTTYALLSAQLKQILELRYP